MIVIGKAPQLLRDFGIATDVCFGSKADMCGAKGHVRFTPNSDRKSGHPQPVMSALPPKADMCGATTDVRSGPIADMFMDRYFSALRADETDCTGRIQPSLRRSCRVQTGR